MNACILVLSYYPDLFAEFRRQVDILAPHTYKVLVRSGELIEPPQDYHWLTEQGDEPFNFSRNVNLGLRAAGLDDVLLCGDDLQVYTPQFVEILQEVAYSDPKIAVAVPELGGQSIFVCGYIKREVLNKIGNLDEELGDYGMQDNDFYGRYEAAGYYTKATSRVVAEHSGGTSFYRREREGGERVQDQCDRMRERFNAKWGIKNA